MSYISTFYYTIVKIFNFILRREDTLFGSKRSPSWRKVRKQYLKANPTCAVCGRKKRFRSNEIHHVVPFHIDQSLELSHNNLITLCREHHFFVGHLNSYHSFNSEVKSDSEIWLNKIKNRP